MVLFFFVLEREEALKVDKRSAASTQTSEAKEVTTWETVRSRCSIDVLMVLYIVYL